MHHRQHLASSRPSSFCLNTTPVLQRESVKTTMRCSDQAKAPCAGSRAFVGGHLGAPINVVMRWRLCGTSLGLEMPMASAEARPFLRTRAPCFAWRRYVPRRILLWQAVRDLSGLAVSCMLAEQGGVVCHPWLAEVRLEAATRWHSTSATYTCSACG